MFGVLSVQWEICRYIILGQQACHFVPTKYRKYRQEIERNSSFRIWNIRICEYFLSWLRNSRYSRFSGLCSNQQYFFFTLEHLLPDIWTPRSLNLVEKSYFMSRFSWTVIFGIYSIFLSFEARWQINGKSRKITHIIISF